LPIVPCSTCPANLPSGCPDCSVPNAVAAARGQVGFPTAQQQDIVLAADEAVSNAVDHAYPESPGTFTLFAAYTNLADAVRIIVSDHGSWRQPSFDPGFRGRGVALMERLAHVFRLVHSPHGTTVVLGWSLLN
jgi:serine/threonine-protein kinase RsbW